MKTVKIGIITNIETNNDEINQIFKILNIVDDLYNNKTFKNRFTHYHEGILSIFLA